MSQMQSMGGSLFEEEKIQNLHSKKDLEKTRSRPKSSKSK